MKRETEGAHLILEVTSEILVLFIHSIQIAEKEGEGMSSESRFILFFVSRGM